MKRVALVLVLAHGGCLAGLQVAVGPAVDERGGAGGVVRLRGTFGLQSHVVVTLVPSSEVAGFQARPRAAFGVGLGAMVSVEHRKLQLNIGARFLIAITPNASSWTAAGGWFALTGNVREWGGGRLSIPDYHLGLGFELAADYTFLAATRSLLLSPSFVFQYYRVGGG